jgi:sugar-specific transcriptional regulator TrmB
MLELRWNGMVNVSDDALSLLKRIGLNQYESRIYTALLSSGNATAGELSELAEVPRSRVYDVLTSLEKKGFAIIQVGRPVKYVAVTPENAMKRVENSYEEEYNKRLQSIANLRENLKSELEPVYEQGKDLLDPSEMIGILRGKVNIYNHIKQIISDTDKHVIKMTDEVGLNRLEKHCSGALESAKKRGVKTRIVAVDLKDKKAVGSLHKHADIRHAKEGGRFFVADRKEALLVTNSNENQHDIGLWVKSPYMAEWLTTLFEHAWEKGKPVSV